MTPDDVRMGPVIRAGPFRVREIAYAAGVRQPTHWHPAMGITLIVGGSIREVAGRREEIGGALSVVVKPAGVEHADEVGPDGARTLQVAFDPDATRDLFDAEPGLARWRWLHGGAAADVMLQLLQAARGSTDSDVVLEDRVFGVLGALEGAAHASGSPPPWLRRAKDALDEAGACMPTVRELAADAGVHEVSLSRAFRRHYGCTISEYRRRSRLRRAAASIEAGSSDVSRIAHAAGYADHAHLCRDFRRATGMTPTEFRRLARDG